MQLLPLVCACACMALGSLSEKHTKILHGCAFSPTGLGQTRAMIFTAGTITHQYEWIIIY